MQACRAEDCSNVKGILHWLFSLQSNVRYAKLVLSQRKRGIALLIRGEQGARGIARREVSSCGWQVMRHNQSKVERISHCKSPATLELFNQTDVYFGVNAIYMYKRQRNSKQLVDLSENIGFIVATNHSYIWLLKHLISIFLCVCYCNI